MRYSRSSPSTFRFSFLTTVPAPWCGYTTLSPTLYKPDLPIPSVFTKPPAGGRPPANDLQNSKSCWKTPLFRACVHEKSLLRAGYAATGSAFPRAAETACRSVSASHERHFARASVPLRDDHGAQPELRALLRPALGLGRRPAAAP